MRTIRFVSAFVLATLLCGVASAAEVKVEMLNRDKAANLSNVYKPGLVKVNKGDTVKWVATNPGHNVAFVQGAVPAGVAPFTSPFQKEITTNSKSPASISTNARRT